MEKRPEITNRFLKNTIGMTLGVFLVISSLSCTTTLNHGTTQKQGQSQISIRSPLTIGGNSVDYQLGLNDKVTLGMSARGTLFPGAEVYSLFDLGLQNINAAISTGILIDPTGYDRKGDRQSFGPWITPTASLAFSQIFGDLVPYTNIYGDYWKISIEVGSEWILGNTRAFLSGSGSYYYNDYGPVEYNNSGLVIAYRKGIGHIAFIPGIAWTF